MVLRRPSGPVLIVVLAHLFLFYSNAFAQRTLPFPPAEEFQVLAPKLQKELGKALEALQANKPAAARGHLETVYRIAPGDADANFLFGFYSAEMNDWVHARNYWEKVLVLAPNHLGALLSLSNALMGDNKPGDAVRYLNQAVEVEPTSWRAHAMLADASLRQGLLNESIRHAELE